MSISLTRHEFNRLPPTVQKRILKLKEIANPIQKQYKNKKDEEIDLIKDQILTNFPQILDKITTNTIPIQIDAPPETIEETSTSIQGGELESTGPTGSGTSSVSGTSTGSRGQGNTGTLIRGQINIKKKYKKIESFKDVPHLVQGLCQGGKTSFIIGISILSFLQHGKSLIILRNSDCDKKQFCDRLTNYIKDLFLELEITKVSIPIIKNGNTEKDGIHVALGNETLIKYKEWEEKSFTMFLDEADLLDTGDSERTRIIDSLKNKSQGYFLVSATVLDCIGKDPILPENVIFINKHPQYKGLECFDYYIEIDPDTEYIGKADGDFFLADKSLHPFCEYYKALPPTETYGCAIIPHMCLINYSHLKKPMMKALETIREKYPNIFTMVQTADGITWSHRGSIPIVDTKSSLSEFIQGLKNRKMFSNIIIIAGDLASRGMSYVSSDYTWHLTHNRVIGPDTRVLTEWIQAVCRLAGIYNDCLPLKLCLKKEDKIKIRKAHFIQEELLLNLSKHNNDKTFCKELIEKMPMFKDKIPSLRNLTRQPNILKIKKTDVNNGMSMAVYEGKELPSDEIYTMREADAPSKKERLTYKVTRINEVKKTSEWVKKYIPTVSTIEENPEEEKKSEDEDGCLLIPSILPTQSQETYNLILEFMEEEHKSGWVERSTIRKWLQDKQYGDLHLVNGRMSSMQKQGSSCSYTTKGLVFKLVQGRWKVRFNR
jgi:hypothetical protein